MNIDANTIAFIMGAAAALFAALYVRHRLEDRFSRLRQDMMDSQNNMWRNIDEMEGRLSDLRDKCNKCCTTDKDTKSFYNSGA